MSNIVKSNAIIPTNLEDLQRLGNMCATSGFFQDARQLAQACVKIAAGAEYGLPPVVSMTGINVIKGRVTLSANVMAAIMKRAGYKLKTRFDGEQSCTITVIDPDGENLGESSFSMDDARKAGLGGDNWKKFPRNMLFARAVSNAARWFAPEVLTGAITPEELGEVEEPPVIEVSEVQQFRNELAALAHTPSGKEVIRIADKEAIIEARIEPEPPMSVETEMFLWRAERAAAHAAEEAAEEDPLPPTSEIRNLNPRANLVKKIHARLREVGLDHDELKKLLPETWSFKTASESDLDCVNALLQCRSLDDLRQQWNFLTKNSLAAGLNDVKNYMKAALEARA